MGLVVNGELKEVTVVWDKAIGLWVASIGGCDLVGMSNTKEGAVNNLRLTLEIVGM